MRSGTDRRIENRSFPAVVAVLVVLAAAADVYYWHQASGPVTGPVVRIPVRFDEPLGVTLIMPEADALAARTATVKRQPDTQSQAREVLAALLSDPLGARSPVLSSLGLRAFFLDPEGTAFVDLAPLTPDGVRASADEELLGIYAIVDSLTRNFGEIRQVRFLVEGREAQTLAGHIDLARTFTGRDDLVKQ